MLGYKTFRLDDSLKFPELETIEGPPYRRYKIDGNLYPSMTSILTAFNVDGDDGLGEWRDRVGHDVAAKITQDAVDRGENLHYISELYLQNKLNRSDVVGPGAVMFNRAKRHLDTLKVILGIEVAVYSHKLEIAGRLDCCAIDEEGDLCIVDHKNSRSPINLKKDYGRKKLYKYMMQCTGYGMCINEMFGVRPTHGKLIISNFRTMDSVVRKFPLKPLEKNFINVVDSFYGRASILDNDYFKL